LSPRAHLLHRRPHALERRQIELVVERDLRERVAAITLLGHAPRARRAQGQVRLHQEEPGAIGRPADECREDPRARVPHRRRPGSKKARITESAEWTRDLTVPTGMRIAWAVSAKVRPSR